MSPRAGRMERSRPVIGCASVSTGAPAAGPAAFRARLRPGIKGLDPGYFALVMATSIVSVAVGAAGAATLAAVLLGLAIGCYLVLVAAHGWRLSWWRPEFAADATDPAKAFAFFTFAAASAVLAAQLAADGHHAWATVLLAAAVLAWLVLGYGLPLRLVTRHGTRPALAGVNGTWFLWTVGTQSIAVALTAFPPALAGTLAPAAVGLWAVGVLLYLLISGLALACLLQFPAEPARLSPAYWVFMGATAISVLAGARILGLPAQPTPGRRPPGGRRAIGDLVGVRHLADPAPDRPGRLASPGTRGPAPVRAVAVEPGVPARHVLRRQPGTGHGPECPLAGDGGP